MPRAKRLLFLIHRWLGIVGCAFFAIWFISGMVMMYVGYPKLTAAERLQHLPMLDAAQLFLSPRQALDRAGVEAELQELRLAAASGGRVVYLAVPAASTRAGQGKQRREESIVIDAIEGKVLRYADRTHALASAAAFAGPGTTLDYQGAIDEDTFTHSRALDAHRPLHRVQLDDTRGTLLYVSSKTGEVVRDATRAERIWNFAGAWIHWLYPLRGNAFDPLWSAIIDTLSIIGILLAFSGLAIGLIRWRWQGTYKSGSRSPYRGLMMRWHHLAGLLFGLLTLTWVFSGLMSMNPWGIFSSNAPALRAEAMNGGSLAFDGRESSPQTLLATASAPVRELQWVRRTGRTLVLVSGADARPAVFDANNAAPHSLASATLADAVARLLPAPVAHIETLTAYDTYYYTREAHTMTGGSDKPLPAWRVVFADPGATWVHVDPLTGTVLGQTDRTRRASRWLFAMLHSWDWLPLLERRPLWDVLLIVTSLGGTALSLTGIVIGWRRLAPRRMHAAVLPAANTGPTSCPRPAPCLRRP